MWIFIDIQRKCGRHQCTLGQIWQNRPKPQKSKYQQIIWKALIWLIYCPNLHFRPWEPIIFTFSSLRGSQSQKIIKIGKKVKKSDFFSKFIFFSKSLNFFTNAWNSMDDGLNRGNEQKISQFYKNSMLEHVNVLGMFCLICIIKFTCPIKKLHGSARPETSLKL